MAAYTTTELLADVRRSGMLPATSLSGLADADLLAYGDKEIQSRLVALVLAAREEFYVRAFDQSITANIAGYRMPYRGIGGRLRDVLLVDAAGLVRNLVRIEPEDAPSYGVGSGVPCAFYVERDSVILIPTPATTTGTLRLKAFMRPNRLVATANVRTIVSVTPNTPVAGTTRVALNAAVHASFTTSVLYDIVRKNPGFEHVGYDLVCSAVAGANIDFSASALPSDFSTANNAGDWVSLAEESPVIQLPAELHQLLAQRIGCRVLEALGDVELLPAAEATAARMDAEARELIKPRVEGEVRKLVGGVLFRNRRGLPRW